MRVRPVPDDRVAEAAQRRLEALVAELNGESPPARGVAAWDGDDPPDTGQGTGQDPVDDVREDPREREVAVAGSGRHARRPLGSGQRAVSWAGDRVPAPLAGLAVGTRHVVVVSALLLVGLLLAGWTYLRSTGGGDDTGEVVAPRTSGGVAVGVSAPAATGAPDPVGAAASGVVAAPAEAARPSPGAELVVDVEGKVRRPGIAVLPPGSRVVDALEAAGGARPGADLRGVNLARPLVDGEQLLVGIAPARGVAAGMLAGPPTTVPGAVPAPGAAGGAAAPALVDLNTADQVMLETLPGVGPVTATAILQWRAEHGAFTSVDELLEVSGIGDATLAEIAPHVTL